jgi:hypothetical protein
MANGACETLRNWLLMKSGMIHLVPARDAIFTAPTGITTPAGGDGPSEMAGAARTSRILPSVIQEFWELLQMCTSSPFENCGCVPAIFCGCIGDVSI